MERTLQPPWRAIRTWSILAAWLVVIVTARVTLQGLVTAGAHLRIPFPPLDAALDWRPNWRLVLPAVVGVVTVAAAPAVARHVRWVWLLLGASSLSALWAVTLALLDGTHGLVGSVTLPSEYYLDVGRVGSPLTFLAGFTGHLADYRVHVQGHPPGYLLLLWLLDRLGVGSVSVVAALEIAGGVLAVPAVLLAVRDVAGEARARAAAPFVAVAPLAIWVATSADALYAGVGAWAVTLVILATGRRRRRGAGYAVVGGFLFGLTAFLSYGLMLLAVIPISVGWSRRRPAMIAAAALGALPVFAVFAAAGFWWIDGLSATRARYFAGVASHRPYLEFLLVNAACFAIALGPATAVALGRLRDRRLWSIVGGALIAVALAWLSGMSKGEVERIWLPFAVWVLPAGAAFAVRGRTAPWLALQVAFTIGLQTLVRSPW